MKNHLRITMAVTFIMLIAIVFYFYVDSQSGEEEKQVEKISNIDMVLSKNLETNYPITPREVLKYFTELQMCLYNEKPDNEQTVKLSYQLISLLDDELRKNNNLEEGYQKYYENLEKEMKEFFAINKVIQKVVLDSSKDVVYSTIEESQYATLNCTYWLKADLGSEKLIQTYILRRDADKNWKILGWKFYEPEE